MENVSVFMEILMFCGSNFGLFHTFDVWIGKLRGFVVLSIEALSGSLEKISQKMVSFQEF